MNAPYDGDRGQGAGSGAAPSGGMPPAPAQHGQVPPPQPAPDPYVQDAYAYDPYRSQDLSAQDPVTEALYDRAAHPPPPPGTYAEQPPLYQQPAAQQYAPDPRIWAQTPPPEPEGPSRHLPYGDDARTTQFVGVDDLVTQAGEELPEQDAFAHLYRDQQQAGAARGARRAGTGSRPAAQARRARLQPDEVQRRDGGGHPGVPAHRFRPQPGDHGRAGRRTAR